MRILVADDDPRVRSATATAIQLDGHEVVEARDGAETLARLAESPVDALVLDWRMPGLDGLAVCRILRDAGDTLPILMLTARVDVSDRVAGLDGGADDYLAKPFDIAELTARLRALLRRAGGQQAEDDTARIGLDAAAGTGTRAGRSFDLTPTEYALLELFLGNEGLVLSRSLIMERVWGDGEQDSNSLPVYVSYLRAKLEAGGEPRLIHTVRGVGYRWGAA